MTLQKAIIELHSCLTKLKEISESEVYQLAIKKDYETVSNNLEKAKHYLKNTINNLEDLLDIEFIESLEIDLSKCVPLTKDMYEKATKLTEGVEVNLDEELEGDFW